MGENVPLGCKQLLPPTPLGPPALHLIATISVPLTTAPAKIAKAAKANEIEGKKSGSIIGVNNKRAKNEQKIGPNVIINGQK